MKFFVKLGQALRSTLAISISIAALVVVAVSLITLAFAQKVCPGVALKKRLRSWLEWAAIAWTAQSQWVLQHLTGIEWCIEGEGAIDSGKNYLVIANHQSWADIPVLEKAIYGRTGLSRYFIKKSLLSLPIVGWVCYALEFPAMHRFSKSMLLKNPELKGKDTEITRRSCQRLKDGHFTLNNYIEGTRFTSEKHRRQQSPYQHLLKPKAGGLSYAINVLHDQIDSILDVTITYIGQPKTLPGVYTGQIKKVVIHIDKVPLSPDLIGNYEEDREFRVHFQAWLNKRWQLKDQRMIDALNVPASSEA